LTNYNSEIIESRWSTFGRVDLVKFLDDDRSMSLFIDGAAGTEMDKFDGNIENTYDNMGTMSVLGSVLALTISTTLGFTASLILGTLCYLAIALIFKFGKQAN